MTEDEDARLSDLTTKMFALLDEVCPGAEQADVHIALSALSAAMAVALVSLGERNLPIVENICGDFGAELLRQVREAHAQGRAAVEAGSRH